MEAMLSTRNEWCISRQRAWGVPIPVFFDENGGVLLTDESIAHVQQCFARLGSDCWYVRRASYRCCCDSFVIFEMIYLIYLIFNARWDLPVEELLAPKYRADGHTYTRGTDTLDVWFDSGSSWRAAVQRREGAVSGVDVASFEF